MLSEIINSGIQPLQNLAVLKKVGDEKKVEWAAHFITKGFKGNTRTLFCIVVDELKNYGGISNPP